MTGTRLENIMPLTWWGISGLSIVMVIILIITIILYRRIKRFELSHIALQTFMSGNQLESLLKDCLQKVDELAIECQNSNARLLPIEEKLRDSVDRVELMRFRAFEDVGSDLSFAFTILNQEGNGAVISVIHNRDESRAYGKPVNQGTSTYMLTEEEKEVIAKAMSRRKF